jgi:hypothetical protein
VLLSATSPLSTHDCAPHSPNDQTVIQSPRITSCIPLVSTRWSLLSGVIRSAERAANCGLRLPVLQAPWSWTDRDVLEAQWPAIHNRTFTSPAVPNWGTSLSTIENLTATPTVDTRPINDRASLLRMPTCVLYMLCDLLDSTAVKNLSEAIDRPWMLHHVVRRRELLLAILTGRADKIRMYFVDTKERYRTKSLIGLALERPSLMAVRALLALGAALSPEDVQLAEGFPQPSRRLVLQAMANYETTEE